MAHDEIERYDLGLLRDAVSYQRWVVDSFGSVLRGRVIDVGAGIGNYTRWIARRVPEVVALEPDPAMCAAIADLGLDNVEVIQRPLEQYTIFANAQFDTAMLIDVLPLWADDMAAIRATGRMLQIGGHVCVLVPAHPQLSGALDARYGHHRRYTKDRMVRLFQGAGFVMEELRYFNLLGALTWLVASRLMRRPHLDPAVVRISESVTVPASRLVERYARVPFGQSLLAIGRMR
ncbi:MAG: class I SAM-dependent methyltransferase [Actinobacteria bacterium]|nr:class I SAM-dependent methyltransferase [Actinomycetota bacterium]